MEHRQLTNDIKEAIGFALQLPDGNFDCGGDQLGSLIDAVLFTDLRLISIRKSHMPQNVKLVMVKTVTEK